MGLRKGLLRKGAVRWGILLFLLGATLALAVLQPQPEVSAQMGPATFDFYGYIKYPNGTFVDSANITIETVNFSAAMFGPPPTVGAASALTSPTGFFNVSNLNNSVGLSYKVKITKYLPGSSTLVTWLGPTLPPFPAFFLSNDSFGILNSTFIIRRAGNLNISVVNASGGRVNFSYELVDGKLGFSMEPPEFNQSKYIYSKILAVPYERNYTVQFHSYNSPPIEFTINNLSSYNTSPACLNNDNCAYIANVTVNNSFGPVTVYGWINTTDFGTFNSSTANFTNLTMVGYLVFGGQNLMSDATMPANMGQFFGLPLDSVLAAGNATGPRGGPFYNITLLGTTTGFDMLLAFYGTGNRSVNPQAKDTYYVGFVSVKVAVGEAPRNINVTLQRAAGATGTQTFSSQSGFGGLSAIVTNLTTFELSGDSSQSVGQAHMEAKLTYTLANDSRLTKTYRWFVHTDQQTSKAVLPIPNITTDLTVQVFSPNFAPQKKKITNAVLNANSTINLSLYQMDIIDPDGQQGGGGLKASVQMDFYSSSATCDVPLPAPSCSFSTFGNAAQFNPMKAMLGGAVSLRIAHTSGVTVHYANVDMMASGPPDAAMDSETGGNQTAGSSFGELWKFGSFGPDVYDFILVGIPYSDNPGDLNDSAPVNMSVPALYDDSWNVIWNTSTNGTNATLLAGNQSDYAGASGDWSTLMLNNTCVTNVTLFNASNPCFINTSANQVWIRIPHFSGTGPAVTGAVTATPSSSSSGSSSSSSGGGGGGGGSSTPSAAGQKATKVWSALNKAVQAEFSITSSEIGVRKIEFTVTNPAQQVTLTVQKLNATPAALPAPPGKVFQALDITARNLNSSHFAAANISFVVNKTWIAANGIDKGTVALVRYAAAWDPLPTTITAEDANEVTYQATTPGFSSFAITGSAAAVPSCGDGTCNGAEDCSTCAQDCGACPVQPPAPTCTAGESRCRSDAVQTCTADGRWQTGEGCPYGCADGACLPQPSVEPMPPRPDATIPVVILIVAVIAAVGAAYLFWSRKR